MYKKLCKITKWIMSENKQFNNVILNEKGVITPK